MSDSNALERRVSAVEQEVEGEKIVSRHILEQTRRNGDDIAAMRTQLARMEQRQDRTDFEVGRIGTELRALRSDLPKLVADSVREVFRERNG